MISLDAAERVGTLIAEAVAGGAKIELGGKRRGVYLEPTVLTHTTAEMKVNCEEVFAPLVTSRRNKSLNDAIAVGERFALRATRPGVSRPICKRCSSFTSELDVVPSMATIPGFRVDRLP